MESRRNRHSGQAERDPESRFLSASGFRRNDGVSDFCRSLEEKLIRFPSLLPSFLSFATRSAPGTILLPFPPYAFRLAPHGIWSFSHAPGPWGHQHGAILLAAVLNTPRAIEVSVFVVRAFVRLREILSTHKALANRLAELKSQMETQDEAIRSLVSAIQQLMAAPERPPKKIGFQLREKRAAYGRG